MNDITALVQRLKVYAEEFSYPVLSPDDCRALVEALEARDKQIAELVAGRMNLMRTMGVYVHAYEEAKSHIAEPGVAATEPVALRWRWNDSEAHWTYAPASRMPEFIAAGFSRENGVVIEYLYTAAPDLESRTVTVKLPPRIEQDDTDGWFMYGGSRVGGGAAEWYNKALDDANSKLTTAGIQVIEGEGQ